MKTVQLTVIPLVILTAAWVQAGDSQDGYLEADGATLYYKTMGEGEPIVVLHGGPGFDHRQFLPYIWELASRHRVILYDQRGTGQSTCSVDSTSINIDSFLADIEAVRKAFGIERMNLLGHSWGGILAMHYAVRHPDRLRSLILCSTAASVDCFGVMRENYGRLRTAEDTALLEEIYATDDFSNGDPAAWEKFWRAWFRSYFADPAQADRMDLTFTANTIENCDAVAGLVLGSIGEFDLHDELAVVRCPTLVIHGDADPMPVSYAERIHVAIAGSELVVAEQVGHWLFIDGTEVFQKSVLDFLARVGE